MPASGGAVHLRLHLFEGSKIKKRLPLCWGSR
ncbi:hypothetical protein RSK20926_15551 [Roseobacter sp. SK209-2-6]|nr:hypothetical protein RSK20926_15551 [Roseobacter sp. SK209-2-6]